MSFDEERDVAEKQAVDRRLTCFIHQGRMYVMDAGTRGLRNEPGWHYERGLSYRESTAEEDDLWRALIQPCAGS